MRTAWALQLMASQLMRTIGSKETGTEGSNGTGACAPGHLLHLERLISETLHVRPPPLLRLRASPCDFGQCHGSQKGIYPRRYLTTARLLADIDYRGMPTDPTRFFNRYDQNDANFQDAVSYAAVLGVLWLLFRAYQELERLS